MSHTAEEHVAHHFDSAEQQKQAASLGMWVFLAQEIMFFGGLVLGYTYYRYKFPDAFMAGSFGLDIGLGAFNTVVLIFSSLTMALAIHAARAGQGNKGILTWLAATMLLGSTFLGVKVIEYKAKIDHHLVPGKHFHFEPHGKFVAAEAFLSQGSFKPLDDHTSVSTSEKHHGEVIPVDAGHAQLFYGFYFVMTGMHALHMIIGLGIMTWLVVLTLKGRFSPAYYNPLEITGLYWHFVDIVWIFLFPLLYLIGRH